MKAVLLDKPGPPSSLRIGEISAPRPGPDEALVRVCAASLNPVDYKVAAQGYERWRYPHVLGVDVAGVIETIGEGVISWNRGDKVFYHTTWRKDGSYAEFNVAPAKVEEFAVTRHFECCIRTESLESDRPKPAGSSGCEGRPVKRTRIDLTALILDSLDATLTISC
jgi:Alcohol dehydrogenase GroES-like domain